ncbi:MAG TPA: hypothetical protein VHX12_00415 [Acidisoma sp.]|jgi:hypothetical protein|nr:hypothetical protein [Acidisoma sp.]
MDMDNSIGMARALLKRYGLQAQAIAEERAEIMAQQEPGSRHVWEGASSAVSEFRRSGSAQASRKGSKIV